MPLLPAIRRRKFHITRTGAFHVPVLVHFTAAPFRKKARSHRLSPCKRGLFTPICSLPPFFGKYTIVTPPLPADF